MSARDLKASGRVSAAILGSRVLGLVREMVFAALFGAGAIADAFIVAFRIPNLLRDLLAEGALSAAFVPTFTATLTNDGEDASKRLGDLVFGGMLMLTGLLVGLGVVFAEPIVASISGFDDPSKLALATRLTRLMMPLLCFVSLAAVWMGVLNAQRHFVVPALAPAMFNVVSLSAGAGVWLLDGDTQTGVLVWSGGTLLAGLTQAGMQVVALWRVGYRPWPRLRGLTTHEGVRRVLRLMLPAVVGVAAVQLNVIINTRFSGLLGDGPVAQLSYAFRLFFLPLGMFGVALATVTTTSVSEAAAQGDRAGIAQRAGDSSAAAWMLAGASAVGLGVLAEPVCSLVYQLGETDAAQITAIAACLQSYVVGLAPYSLVKILAPAFYAIDKPRVPLIASVTGVAVNIGFNALTFRQLGAPGIALGTALGATANVVVLRIAFRRHVGALPSGGMGRAVALVVGLVALGSVSWAGAQGLSALKDVVPWEGLLGKAALGAALAGVIGAAFLVYAALLKVLKYPGADLLLGLPAGLWRRLSRRRARS
ncbi:MAG: murein biosynthesis integral membrane protein MurJ [Myxococcota bacterium]